MENIMYVEDVKTGNQLMQLRMKLMRHSDVQMRGQQQKFMSRPELERLIKKAYGDKKTALSPAFNQPKLADVENNNRGIPESWLKLLPQVVLLWFTEQGRPHDIFLSRIEEKVRNGGTTTTDKDKPDDKPGDKGDDKGDDKKEKKSWTEEELDKIKSRAKLALEYHADGSGVSLADLVAAIKVSLAGLTEELLRDIIEDLSGRTTLRGDDLRDLLNKINS